MAEADFTEVTGSLPTGDVARGVTAGITPPGGGGSYVYGFNSKSTSQGVVALFCNLTDFAPTASGASVRAAIKRGAGGGNTNFSPFIFAGLQGTSYDDEAYILGISDDDPGYISLVKGRLVDGVPSGAPGTLGVLSRSVESFDANTWLHLRLDMIANPSGDTVLNVYRSDLDAHYVDNPAWTFVSGMSFVDDSLGVNSGSVPFSAGRHGFGFASRDVTRRAYFDAFELLRQT